MKIRDLQVVVAGAATAGAATALLLARRGARVRVFEKVAAPRAVGAGIAIAPNGRAVLSGLGLGEKLEALANRIDGARITDAAGRTLLDPPQELTSPGLLMMRRAALQSILLDALENEPNVELQLGVEVLGVTPTGEVVAESAGSRTTHSADLVVGADGLHSRVRTGGDFGARLRDTKVSYVRGLGPVGLAGNSEAWTAAGLFGSFALPDATYFFSSAVTPPLRDAVAAKDLEAFRAVWQGAYPNSAALLDSLVDFAQLLVNSVIEVHLRRFDHGRIVLVGDAAHAMAPNLGQGGNSALVDAAALADELEVAPDLPSALASYTCRRLPAVRQVQRNSARLGRLAELTHPMARLLRDRLLLPLARRMPTARAAAVTLQEPATTLFEIAARQFR